MVSLLALFSSRGRQFSTLGSNLLFFCFPNRRSISVILDLPVSLKSLSRSMPRNLVQDFLGFCRSVSLHPIAIAVVGSSTKMCVNLLSVLWILKAWSSTCPNKYTIFHLSLFFGRISPAIPSVFPPE